MRDRKVIAQDFKKERQALLAIIDILLSKNHKGLAIKKLKGSDFIACEKRFQDHISLQRT